MEEYILDEKWGKLLNDVVNEYESATSKFGSFNNAHEGYAVLLEEVDELWDNIKLNQKNPERIRKIRQEAVQVAVMALRFLYDVC